MRVEKLTKTTLASVKPGAGDVFVWDGTLPGFGVKVTPSGTRVAVFQYRIGTASKRLTIGKLHDGLTLEQARDEARKHSAKVTQGGDPVEQKKERREAISVGQMLMAYATSPRMAEKSKASQATDLGRIKWHITPLLGKKPAAGLTPDDLRSMFADVAAGKTAVTIPGKLRGVCRVKGGEGAARKCVVLLKAITRWAADEEMVPASACDVFGKVDTGHDGQREVMLSDEQYSTMFQALAELEQTRQMTSAAADFIRLTALTGARRGELLGMRWQHVDIEGRRVVLTEHKTAKTGKPRIIHLDEVAIAIIQRQPEGTPNQRVFPGTRGEADAPLAIGKPWGVLRRAAGLPDDVSLHGLRHSVASHMAMSGANLPALQAVMGHRQMGTSQRYIHFAEQRRAALAEQAARPAAAALLGVKV